MLRYYRTIEDVLRSPWAEARQGGSRAQARTDRVLQATKLEDSIYADLCGSDEEMQITVQTAEKKLPSFPSLSRDVYQSFYSLMPKRISAEDLSTAARKFNAPILNRITESEDYPTLKSICEGRELPAYEATAEFISRTACELDGLMESLGGKKGAVSTLEKLEQAEGRAADKLADLLERLQKSKRPDPALEQAAVSAANAAESRRRQVEAVGKLIDTETARNKDKVECFLKQAVSAAADRAEEVNNILGAWGDDPGDMEKNEANTELLSSVRKSDVLKNVAKYLGRFREIFAQSKRNGFAYGRGEKYSLELGNDLTRALTAELGMLAAAETQPLFLRKYQNRQIKQYCRREPVYKGMGDIICCLDESGSTRGDLAAWGKAVAPTLLEIAADSGRRFALIHFSGPGRTKTDVFRPAAYSVADKMAAAECFLGGGTDFETPLSEAVRLMEQEYFENADVVFITDGECAVSEEYLSQLQTAQAERRFSITGILLDKGCSEMDFSLMSFCQRFYRTSELLGDEIVRKIVSDRV